MIDAKDSIEVELYTDGACSGNPGPGGWAFILRHLKTKTVREDSGAERDTTNNRMELLAVIRGLEALKRPCYVELFTDSVYVGKGLSDWMPKWKQRGWKRSEGGKLREIKNVELWKELDRLLQIHRVKYSGHPENDRCDEMAVEAYRRLLGR
jgi:ribonuclease HI